MKRIFLLCFVFTFSMLLLSSNITTSNEYTSSKLLFKSDSFSKWNDQEFDFYFVYDGEIIKTNLILKNISDKIIDGKIKSTIPFFTISPVDQFSIKPGEEMSFDLTLDATGQENKRYMGGRILIQLKTEVIEVPIWFYIKPKILVYEIVIDASENHENRMDYNVNGEIQYFQLPPEIINGRTLVDVRSINDIFGSEVEYNVPTKTLTCYYRKSELVLIHKNTNAKLNGKNVILDVPPMILRGRFFIPLRFFAEKFCGSTVEWDPITHKILITYDLTKRITK